MTPTKGGIALVGVDTYQRRYRFGKCQHLDIDPVSSPCIAKVLTLGAIHVSKFRKSWDLTKCLLCDGFTLDLGEPIQFQALLIEHLKFSELGLPLEVVQSNLYGLDKHFDNLHKGKMA